GFAAAYRSTPHSPVVPRLDLRSLLRQSGFALVSQPALNRCCWYHPALRSSAPPPPISPSPHLPISQALLTPLSPFPALPAPLSGPESIQKRRRRRSFRLRTVF